MTPTTDDPYFCGGGVVAVRTYPHENRFFYIVSTIAARIMKEASIWNNFLLQLLCGLD